MNLSQLLLSLSRFEDDSEAEVEVLNEFSFPAAGSHNDAPPSALDLDLSFSSQNLMGILLQDRSTAGS